jgi:hypothetical protein
MDNGANMIPAFLTSLADLMDRLVSECKAVHVTAEIAAEMRLLAGLPWDEGSVHEARSEDGRDFVCENCGAGLGDEEIGQLVSPADVVLGWLLASKAEVETIPSGYGSGPMVGADEERCQRAAVCAELAVLAIHVLPRFEGDEPGVPRPHDGTREGARAAWAFIVRILGTDRYSANQEPDVQEEFRIRETYRLELEAMR